MATTHGRMPVLTNPFLWALVVVSASAGGLAWGVASGLGIFAGGVLGIMALAVVARFFDEITTPTRDSTIDPWDD